VPLSTFNSSKSPDSNFGETPPQGYWLRTWLLAIGIVVVFLAVVELVGRGCGVVPSVSDDVHLWCLTRASVREDDPNEVVMIGASRIQLAVNTAVFAESFGRAPVQLAVNGSSCLPVLEHLSRSRFCGIVICDVSVNIFFGGMDWHEGTAMEYVRAYESRTAVELIEARLRVFSQEHRVFGLPELGPRAIVGSLLRGKPPQASFVTRLPDRSVLADYSKIDVAAAARYREQVTREGFHGADESRVDQDLRVLETIIERIRSRGGRVVFLMMPVSGTIRQIENERFPRSRCWDLLVARTHAICIHYADYAQLQFNCPEGSHLDYRDGPAFTRALVDILKLKLAADSSTCLTPVARQ
jgi:hypothetical protein